MTYEERRNKERSGKIDEMRDLLRRLKNKKQICDKCFDLFLEQFVVIEQVKREALKFLN